MTRALSFFKGDDLSTGNATGIFGEVSKERPRRENVVDLMEALRRCVRGAAAESKVPEKPAKKLKKSNRWSEGNADAEPTESAALECGADLYGCRTTAGGAAPGPKASS